MKLSLKTASKSHRVLLFGPPKSGKTLLAGSVSSDYDVLLIDLEAGFDTLKQLPHASQEKIEVISLPDTRSFPIAIETCLKIVKGGAHEICEAHGKISCAICKKAEGIFTRVALHELPLSTIVIFDSLTQLTNSAMAHIGKDKPDDFKFEYDHWAHLGKIMDMFLSHIQQAPYNVICISHETEVEMEDGGNKLVPTAGTRNFSRNTAKYFDEVVYCEVKNKKHVAASSTTYGSRILSGSRSGIKLEDSPGAASLIPIFSGEKIAPVAPSQETQAHKAVTDVAALRERLAAARGPK